MATAYWHEVTIPHGRGGRFRIGPLTLDVERARHEWRISSSTTGDDADETVSFELGDARADSLAGGIHRRIATSSDTERFRVLPVVPDRSVVTRLERPVTILPRMEMRLYVGSPVWVRLLEGPGDELLELPVSSPREAWFGPNTREGDVCYATRTPGRLELGDAPVLPHRMTTAVSIHNDRDQPFALERVQLPVRRLSIYASDTGRLWTEAVRLDRTESADLARLTVEKEPPAEADGATRLSPPRDPSGGGGLFRAFGLMFW
jgi:hypothetical protein